MDLNGSLFHAINRLAGHSAIADDAMKFAAQYAIYAIAAIVALSWFVRAGDDRNRRMAVYTSIAAGALAVAVALVIQHFYVHQRPFVLRTDVVQLVHHSADASFPSEHATAAFGMAGGLGLYRARIGLVLLLLAALIGFSRVFVGIHYPGDVAGGAAIGALAAGVLWLAQPALDWIDRTLVVRLVPQPLL